MQLETIALFAIAGGLVFASIRSTANYYKAKSKPKRKRKTKSKSKRNTPKR